MFSAYWTDIHGYPSVYTPTQDASHEGFPTKNGRILEKGDWHPGCRVLPRYSDFISFYSLPNLSCLTWTKGAPFFSTNVKVMIPWFLNFFLTHAPWQAWLLRFVQCSPWKRLRRWVHYTASKTPKTIFTPDNYHGTEKNPNFSKRKKPFSIHLSYFEVSNACPCSIPWNKHQVFWCWKCWFQRLRPWTWWIRLDLHGEYCDVTITLMLFARPFVANDFPVLQLSQDRGGGVDVQCKTAGFLGGR